MSRCTIYAMLVQQFPLLSYCVLMGGGVLASYQIGRPSSIMPLLDRPSDIWDKCSTVSIEMAMLPDTWPLSSFILPTDLGTWKKCCVVCDTSQFVPFAAYVLIA